MKILRDFLSGRILKIGQAKKEQRDKGKQSLQDIVRWLSKREEADKEAEGPIRSGMRQK